MTQFEQSSQCNRLIEKSKNRKILFTLKAWPVITAVTIGLCFLTQWIASLFGIDLPEQTNVDVVRRCGLNCFKSWRSFFDFAFILAQVLVILPALEEFIFRGLLFRLPCKWVLRKLPSSTPQTLPTLSPLSTLKTLKTLSPLSTLKTLSPLSTLKTLKTLLILSTLSSILFSSAHYLMQPFPDNAFLALFFFGLAQCWLYRRTSRIWCAILNHALFNLTNLTLLFVLPQG